MRRSRNAKSYHSIDHAILKQHLSIDHTYQYLKICIGLTGAGGARSIGGVTGGDGVHAHTHKHTHKHTQHTQKSIHVPIVLPTWTLMPLDTDTALVHWVYTLLRTRVFICTDLPSWNLGCCQWLLNNVFWNCTQKHVMQQQTWVRDNI